MTKRRSGYYVTARLGGNGNGQTAWLLGPWFGKLAHMTALSMVEPARRAANRTTDPRFAFAAFGIAKRTATTHPPGVLNLSFLRLDDIVAASVKGKR